jgi:hypothetical protein
MRRVLLLTLVLSVLALSAASALAAPPVVLEVKGRLTPAPLEGDEGNYALLISDQAINAQDGADVIVTGSLGELPENANYWVEIGLVPKVARDELVAGTLDSLWDEGVYLLSAYEGEGVFSLAAEDYEGQAGAPARGPLANDGKITFKLTLKPRLSRAGSKGGTATLMADGRKTNQGKPTLAYGKTAEADPQPSEDYSAAYLVAQVYAAKSAKPVQVSATAKLAPYGARVREVAVFNPAMTDGATFHPGQAVILEVRYLVFSAEKAQAYAISGEVELFGQVQKFNETRPAGKYGVMRAFMVPFQTKPGTYGAKVKLQLSLEGQTLYTDEVVKNIKVK